MMQLWLEGHKMDMGKAIVAQTFQVNDIAELKYRQATRSNIIKLPRTPKNTQVFKMLGISGNTSLKPYRKLDAKLTISGIELVSRGWAVIQKTNNFYEAAVYDGYIHFIKAIENQSLTDIGISELNHLKNLNNVIETWTDDTLPYKYIVADYNGKMIYNNNKLNIDYLIPSVNVKYLWDKLFNFYGYTYEGSVFYTEAFKNLWLTYPKTIGDDSQQTTLIHTWLFNDAPQYYIGPIIDDVFGLGYRYSNYFTHNPIVNNIYLSSSINNPNGEPDGGLINVVETGLYKFSFIGNLNIYAINTSLSYEDNIDIVLIKIEQGQISYEVLVSDIEQNQVINHTAYIQLQTGENFQLTAMKSGDETGLFFGFQYQIQGSLSVDVKFVEGNVVDFEEALIDLEVRSFIEEILWNFSLTPFHDKHSNHISFLTHEEWFQNANILDWSNKYIDTIEEEYILDGYAQKNYLKRKYNSSEQSHNDGFFLIKNVNLNDKVDLIKSKIYSPEIEKSIILGEDYNVYKFWNKENKDDGTVKYKELKGRFYFLRSEPSNTSLSLGSEFQSVDTTVTNFFKENYSRLSFKEIVQDFYLPIYNILNKSRIVIANIYLNDLDISNLDFKKLVYIKQLASNFLINKIPNYTKAGIHSVELIEVNSFNEEYQNFSPKIILTSISFGPNPPFSFSSGISSQYAFLDFTPISATITAKQIDDYNPGTLFPYTPPTVGSYTGFQLSESLDVNDNLHVFNFGLTIPETQTGWYEVQIIDDDTNLMSNKQYVFFEDTSTNPDPSIFVDADNTGEYISPIRDIIYKFNHFSPTSATLKIREYDFFNNQPVGGTVTIPITNLTQDTLIVLEDVDVGTTNGWLYVELTTDVISIIKVVLVNN